MSNQTSNDSEFTETARALREVTVNEERLAQAVMAVRDAQPRQKRRVALSASIVISAVAVPLLVIALGSLAKPSTAAKVKEISLAQQAHPIWHRVSYRVLEDGAEIRNDESWYDGHGKTQLQAFRLVNPEGEILSSDSWNGKVHANIYGRNTSVSNSNAEALLEEDEPAPQEMETLEYWYSLKNLKPSAEGVPVKLHGKAYELYAFGKGTYRLFVDPQTHLIMEREVWNHGTALMERDVYDYPASLASSTFDPPQISGVTYINYATMRQKFYQSLSVMDEQTLPDGQKVQLLGAARGSNDFYVVLKFPDGIKNGINEWQVTDANGAGAYAGNGIHLDKLGNGCVAAGGAELQHADLPKTFKVTVEFFKDAHGRVGEPWTSVGKATFNVKSMVETRWASRLIAPPDRRPRVAANAG